MSKQRKAKQRARRRPATTLRMRPPGLEAHALCTKAIDDGCGILLACDSCWSAIFAPVKPRSILEVT